MKTSQRPQKRRQARSGSQREREWETSLFAGAIPNQVRNIRLRLHNSFTKTVQSSWVTSLGDGALT